MQNNTMPRKKTSITLPFSEMDKAGPAWPMLAAIARMASEYPYGVIPASEISIGRFLAVYSTSDELLRRDGSALIRNGIIQYVKMTIKKRGNGWSKTDAVEGWMITRWHLFSSDSRNMSKNELEVLQRPLFPDVISSSKKSEDQSRAEEFKKLEKLATDCMVTGGRRGRRILLDQKSVIHLKSMYDDHGYKKVEDALEKCAGADRPVAMARKILMSKHGLKKAGIPNADEWREG